MEPPSSARSFYHISDDGSSINVPTDFDRVHSQPPHAGNAHIIQENALQVADSDLLHRSAFVLIRLLLTRAHLRLMLGDLEGAQAFVDMAWVHLDSLKDKSMGANIEGMQNMLNQYRSGGIDLPRRSPSPPKQRPTRPPPLNLGSQQRSSGGDQVTSAPSTQDSVFKQLMEEINDGITPRSAAPITVRSSKTVTSDDAHLFFERVVSTQNQKAQSQQPSSSSSSSFVGIEKFEARLKEDLHSKKRPLPRTREAAARYPSGGIDMFFRNNFEGLPYSPNIKDLQTPDPYDDTTTSKWNNALPTPSGFTDPFRGSTPRSSTSTFPTNVNRNSTLSELCAPRAERAFRHGVISPIRRPSHPPPQISIPANAASLAHGRSSIPSSIDSSEQVRRTSTEDIEPETTDGPALPKLLTSMQANPHSEHLPTSPTERVRRLSIDEAKVMPTKRPSLTIPFNMSATEKTAASTPSPLRQSFSAAEIEFEGQAQAKVNQALGDYSLKTSPSSRHKPSKIVSPEVSPKSTPASTPKSSPRVSRIPVRTAINSPSLPSKRSSNGTTISEEIRRDKQREVERKKREGLLLEKQRRGEYVPAKPGRKR